ncbi:hypothetical protein E2C01_045991 [Portunus trituberculatus]|uniref:Uncharacterized protein n=1 Tax=Portunus trituberculatus TaxID=210409 RepID=A0A5B7FWL0_PORTR|nr:hypothetical protein [Portunus trituberculatus]
MGVEAPGTGEQDAYLCRLSVQGECYNFHTMDDVEEFERLVFSLSLRAGRVWHCRIALCWAESRFVARWRHHFTASYLAHGPLSSRNPDVTAGSEGRAEYCAFVLTGG